MRFPLSLVVACSLRDEHGATGPILNDPRGEGMPSNVHKMSRPCPGSHLLFWYADLQSIGKASFYCSKSPCGAFGGNQKVCAMPAHAAVGQSRGETDESHCGGRIL